MLTDTIAYHEPVVFAMASSALTARRELVLIKELIVPPETAFVRTNMHGAKWTGRFNIEMMNRCADNSCGLIIFHRHPGRNVQLSHDDRESAETLIPYFQSAVPQRYHGSLVLGDDSVAGMVWRPGQQRATEVLEVRFLGGQTLSYSAPSFSDADQNAFTHVPLAYGRITRHLLATTSVAVVGLSGGGSQLVTQLASIGIGGIVAIDPQRFASENRLSTDAPRFFDIALRLHKTSVVKRQVLAINPRCSFRAIRAAAPSKEAIAALREVDIVIGCVNNLQARADMLEITGRYGIPYIDIGFNVGVDGGIRCGSQVISLAGNVFTIIPGSACMWCSSFLTKAKLQEEMGGADRSYFKLRRGIRSDAGNALVLPFNGVLASSAATEVLQLVVGFNAERRGSLYRKYDGLSGEMSNWGVQQNEDCWHCRNVVHAGDALWS
jgi:molybdopterin/thiamine biosynthesis adenylyltransferase